MSFGAVADDYDRLRPVAPPQAIDWLLDGARRDVVVDLGAGTGLQTRALAELAGHVIAVEPDGRMRAVLAARSPQVEAVDGRGEQIPLPDASADALLISSAWHWMDPALAVPEIARVLRDDGRLAVVWTGRDRDVPWLRAGEWFRRERATSEQAAAADGRANRQWNNRAVVLPYGSPFRNVETASFGYERLMPIPDVVEWITTHSQVILLDEQEREAGRARGVAALQARFPGATEIEVPMRSRCWRADRVPR